MSGRKERGVRQQYLINITNNELIAMFNERVNGVNPPYPDMLPLVLFHGLQREEIPAA